MLSIELEHPLNARSRPETNRRPEISHRYCIIETPGAGGTAVRGQMSARRDPGNRSFCFRPFGFAANSHARDLLDPPRMPFLLRENKLQWTMGLVEGIAVPRAREQYDVVGRIGVNFRQRKYHAIFVR